MDSKNEKSVQERIRSVLSDGASQLMSIILPVTICLFTTTALVSLRPPKAINLFDIMRMQELEADSSEFGITLTVKKSEADDFGSSFIFVMMMVGMFAVMTFGMVILFKYAPANVIKGVFFVLLFLIFTIHNMTSIGMIVKGSFFPIDFMSLGFCVYNFAVVGVVIIILTGPLILRQMYMIYLGVCVSYMLVAMMPKYVVWILVSMLVVWDIIAVLCPRGPLNMLIDVVSKKEDKGLLNPLMYSTAANIIFLGATNDEIVLKESTDQKEDNSIAYNLTPKPGDIIRLPDDDQNTAGPNLVPKKPIKKSSRPKTKLEALESNLGQRGESGMHLGMGDFVFYGLLMSRVALDGNLSACVACYLAIILGLITTVVILLMVGRALPALPISITISVILYIFASNTSIPFIDCLIKKQTTF